MPKQHALKGGIICSGVKQYRFTGVVAFYQRQGILETQDMLAVGLPPTECRNDGNAGAKRQERDALECACRVAAKIHDDSILF